MESLYKKKTLKFSGYRKEINKKEIKTAREASRLKRFSILRESFEASKENISEQHKHGEKKKENPSRYELLQKWKEEKALKKPQKESTMRSVPKPGFCLKKQISSISKNNIDAKLNAQSSTSVTQRIVCQNPKNSTVTKSASQIIMPTSMRRKPAVPDTVSFSNVKTEIPQRPAASKSALNLKAIAPLSLKTSAMPGKAIAIPGKAIAIPGKAIAIPGKTVAIPGKTVAKEIKLDVKNPPRVCSQPSKIASVRNTRIASKSAVSQPKVTQKLPLVKSKLEKDVKSANTTSVKKLSKITFPKHTNDAGSRFGKNQMAKDHSTKSELKEPEDKTGKIFLCDISRIESCNRRESFAPSNFLFRPPVEWNFPLQFDVSSPSQGVQRTSSPLRSDFFSTKKNEDLSPIHNLKKRINSKDDSPGNILCQRDVSDADSQSLCEKADIFDIKVENHCASENINISLPVFTANLSTKLPLLLFDDIHAEGKDDTNKKITDLQDVLSFPQKSESTLHVALDDSTSQIASKNCDINLSKTCLNNKVTDLQDVLNFPQNSESTLHVALDDSTSQIASKNCDINLSKTIQEEKKLETAKCANMILTDSASLNPSHVLVPIDDLKQNTMENCPNCSIPSLSKNLKHDKLYETDVCNTFDTTKCVNSEALADVVCIDSSSQNLPHILLPISDLKQNTVGHLPHPSATNLSKIPEHHKLYEAELCASFDSPKDNQLINIDSVDVIFSHQPNDNIPENSDCKSVVPLSNGSDFFVLGSNQSLDQDKPLETGCIPKVLEKSNQIETDKLLSSCSLPENGLGGVENRVDECATSLRESLKSLAVSETISRKVSMRHKKISMSHKFALESINESIESRETPCPTPKSLRAIIAEENFSPRRSPRLLEKLNGRSPSRLNRSGSFESIFNEKPEMINCLDLDDVEIGTAVHEPQPVSNFTPRRSQRISEIMRRSSSSENLFKVRQPSVMDMESPSNGGWVKNASKVTYDFENLCLEDSPKVAKAVKRCAPSRKVSLLYTPPGRKSVLRQSISADLMSFSPSS